MRSPPGATWNQESSGAKPGTSRATHWAKRRVRTVSSPGVAGRRGVGLEPEVGLLRSCRAGRKVEGLADGAVRLQPDSDDVIGGRPEAVGVA